MVDWTLLPGMQPGQEKHRLMWRQPLREVTHGRIRLEQDLIYGLSDLSWKTYEALFSSYVRENVGDGIAYLVTSPQPSEWVMSFGQPYKFRAGFDHNKGYVWFSFPEENTTLDALLTEFLTELRSPRLSR